MSITTKDVTGWQQDLDSMIGDVTDASARTALESLRSALEPYFEKPEYFRSVLSKIQKTILTADVESEITSHSFADIEELKAMLPDDVAVTTIQ
ncbi:hypothetical protein JL475_34650 [Streptomyces sp. M2CJ-2]|uniref:hypothetical protein n=1 Tax=Streptomyces sp. M2CJ-2 TaxID=2803948 RepID=UPI001925D2F0|nr:hypothetical protein [Streptomyces sp. M2CJ-2]MBL3670996.1 hypothetical protein [Streptomyces sp. M2CJ-2]